MPDHDHPLSKLLPVPSQWHTLKSGHRLHFMEAGPESPDAPPALMLHGNPSWCYLYRNLLPELATTHRCIAPDHIGMGASDKPGDRDYSYTLAQRVADLDELINARNITQPITLIVHDWGGMIGMLWAARNPERIGRIVALNTGAFPLPPSKPLPWQIGIVRNTPLGALLVRGLNGFARGAAYFCTVNRMPRSVRNGFVAPYYSWATRIATLRFVQDIPLKPGDRGYELVLEAEAGLKHFRERKTPTLLYFGLRDFVFDRHFLAGWQERLPHAETRSFVDAGHYVLEDRGAAGVREIADWCRGQQPPPSDA